MEQPQSLNLILFLVLYLVSCNNRNIIAGSSDFRIDTSIVASVKKNLRYFNPIDLKSFEQNKISIEFYINGRLELFDIDTSDLSIYSKYYWIKDTLTITASIAELSTTGFVAQINKG